MKRREVHLDNWRRGQGWPEAFAQSGKVQRLAGMKRGVDGLGQLSLAAAIVRQRKQFNRRLAGSLFASSWRVTPRRLFDKPHAGTADRGRQDY